MKSSNASVWVTNLNKIAKKQVKPAFFDGDIYVTSFVSFSAL